MRLCHHSTRFILISTQHNENVGAAARAIKTMGFDDLALVSPRDKKVLGRHKVIQMSSGAIDVLRNAKIYTTLHEAIEDRDVVCGTGMPDFDLYRDKSRVVKLQHVEPRVYFDELLQSRCYKRINIDTKDDNEGAEGNDDQAVRLAIVFGSEQTGMSESDMAQCDVMLGIPTNPNFGSLNVAAAAQLIAYDWRMAIGWDEQ
ncbi:hypothetical protein ACHAWU_006859 [Discostella pseudostelligera]|uniref:tRNA/rRNA methyltransferase SpoU type domain-containing protein n=1 Tax=Discostella pseudostelligera TaxID=259834 RepID=A0ABD3N0H0_9STRA